MYEYKDLRRLTTIACAAVIIYLVSDVLVTVGALIEGAPSDPTEVRMADFGAMIELVLVLVTMCIVGRWIYRASVNAHAFSDDMSVSPGWSVGWYFIPLANLFKPFQAMKEIWFASHVTDGSFDEKAPAIISWWWGLWIINGFLGHISLRMSLSGEVAVGTIDVFNLVTLLANGPLCILLVKLMQEVARSQDFTRNAETFA